MKMSMKWHRGCLTNLKGSLKNILLFGDSKDRVGHTRIHARGDLRCQRDR